MASTQMIAPLIKVIKGKAWFKADDVCKTLGYESTDLALLHVEAGDLIKGETGDVYVSKPGVNKLIYACQSPSVDMFRAWLKEAKMDLVKTLQNEARAQDDYVKGVLKEPIKKKLEQYLATLPAGKEISRKQAYDAIDLNFGRLRADYILDELQADFPEVIVKPRG